jgi:hypothetical protein
MEIATQISVIAGLDPAIHRTAGLRLSDDGPVHRHVVVGRD